MWRVQNRLPRYNNMNIVYVTTLTWFNSFKFNDWSAYCQCINMFSTDESVFVQQPLLAGHSVQWSGGHNPCLNRGTRGVWSVPSLVPFLKLFVISTYLNSTPPSRINSNAKFCGILLTELNLSYCMSS